MPQTKVTVPTRVAALRALGFTVLWILLTESNPEDLAAGAVAVFAATWTSLRLLPPGTSQVRPLALGQFALRFLRQSLIAGVDVARRALDLRLPLAPGFVHYSVGLPPGPARNMLTSLMSLLPGSLPIGAGASGGLLIHCLDVEQPIAAQLAAEEAHFARVIVTASTHG